MRWVLRLFSLLALAGFSAAVWYAGPLIRYADTRPLGPVWLRTTIIGAAVALLAIFYGIRFWRARKAQNALETGIVRSGDRNDDSEVLEARMSEAIATLKQSSGRRNFLYEIPWYIIIGPPGAGKTTALVNSGLKFPLAGSGNAQPLAGVGGTRSCDWWFTEDAVLIDTAGRYTTQDSDAQRDKASWLGFLVLLKKYRTRQPINGVILAISVADLIGFDDQQLDAHVTEIRSRLRELHETLKIQFPVYLLFTKADLVAGFMDYFGDFDEVRRRKVWGATFQTTDRNRNMVGETSAEFDALARQLAGEIADRLQDEADPVARIAIFGFPAQFVALRTRVVRFVTSLFDASRAQVNVSLRGLYFSSGTQEGTPIDQVLGAIGRNFGSASQAHLSGTGKSFFLHDLLAKVIFPEAGWVSFDRTAERRARLARFGSLAAIALVAFAALGVLGLSYFANESLIGSTRQAMAQYRDGADSLLRSTTVTDVDLENVIGPLDQLRNLPAGYETAGQTKPIEESFGLSQRERLLSASKSVYRQALERSFRSRLLVQAERTIQAKMADPIALYEPLKIYLMLGGKAPKVDDELIISWMKQDWEENRYPGENNREGRAQLEKHLRAMLALDDAYDPVFELNQPLVEAAQRSLGRMSLADRASALIRSAVYAARLQDFSVAAKAGPEAQLLFERMDGAELADLGVPGLYTKAGFNGFYLPQLSRIAQMLVDDQWVLGGGGEQGGIDQDLPRLGPELIDRYGKEFASAWNGALDQLKFKAMLKDKPQYITLSAAASPDSPLDRLFTAIADETALTKDGAAFAGDTGTAQQDPVVMAKGLARIGLQIAGGKSQSRAGASSSATQNAGASVEAQFRPFQALVSGSSGRRPLDALTQNFHDIYQSVKLAADVPAQTERVNANLKLQISTMRANASRLPKQLARMVDAAADEFEGNVAETSVANLNQMLDETVTRPCEEAVNGHYPFAGDGSEEISLADFAKLFAPGGLMDRFFAQNLAPLIDMTGQDWTWKQEARSSRDLAKSTLKAFQSAAEIRSAFFPSGGSAPSVSITFTPSSLNSEVDSAVLNIDGQTVQSTQAGNAPSTVTWPGGGASGSASLSLTPEMPGRESALKFEGPWALKRLLDKASVTSNGAGAEARFVIGGRDVAYKMESGSGANPFLLPALSRFSCPKAF
ncbi:MULTISPECIES: type VI secretion system membrane subunit TssM [unclassified Mesorhizobium]|uniref:type VI secretion system membrane subunit TssM n=4 Tax=Mesorhizobium TaxID=68287 RepID=UPI00167655C6|nr:MULTISPECIES: type VI secretion system membrane subunit TssM [unclassified Mesorhizobium]MCT2578124.1 type VI secretion system membrane subunit TssM [Mesorhizobium sp. P13.3]MDF3167062.1 type VI secretion system membrane subunit TssM [Mesorhizobium sp. P16.1]MDF3177591.1 type VI secretion system membrane subunit TssM [Mesorhizobium sp. P17.1]MDF3183849.1 type VI secretion system membrane subunit TssM [Mesorhizobium sp. ICCV3110.1]